MALLPAFVTSWHLWVWALGPTATSDLDPAMPTTAPWFEPVVTEGPRPLHLDFHEPGILFINFDGGQMQSCNGSNWPVNNCSTIMHGEVLPYSGSANARAAVVQAMANDVADFAIEVVDTRPSDDVEYDMIMVGDWNPPPSQGGFAGVAPTIDCWNTNRSETAFSLDFNSPSVVAKIVGQEAAHLWGLEHVDSAGDLLYPTIGGAADPRFENVCHQIVLIDGGIVPTEAVCPEMHALNCDEPNHQNSYLDMLMIFGPPSPDIVPPTLEILSPTEGEVFPSGSDVAILIHMQDDLPPQLFTVYAGLDPTQQGPRVGNKDYLGPELVVPVVGLPDGEHTVRVDILDQDGNQATDTVTFFLGQAPDPGDESSGDDAPETTGDTLSGTTASGGNDDDPLDDTSSSETEGPTSATTDDSGCACRTTPTPPLSLLVLLPLFAPLLTPRRPPTPPQSHPRR